MAEITMTGEYRGYKICWDDFSKSFNVMEEGLTIKASVKDLTNCQIWIDSHLKVQFNRVNVIYCGYDGRVKKGVVTSMIDENHYAWFTDTSKNRSKVSISLLYLDNEYNVELFKEMSDKRKQINGLNTEINALGSKAEHLTPEMMTTKPMKEVKES